MTNLIRTNLILKPPKRVDPPESYHQAQVIYMAELHKDQFPALRHLFHVPNGGYRHKATAAAMTRQGVRPGVEDLFLDCARGGYFGLRIELKRFNGVPSDLSAEQKEWIAFHNQEGYRAVMCRGWEEAWREIVWYLSLPTTEIGYNKSVPPWCS